MREVRGTAFGSVGIRGPAVAVLLCAMPACSGPPEPIVAQAQPAQQPEEQPAAQREDRQADSPSIQERLMAASPYVIAQDEELTSFVESTATDVIDERCAACHGPDLTGRSGAPNLVDFDWLWGITFEETNDVGPVMELQQTIQYGIRNEDCPEIEDVSYYGACADTRYSEMPAYGELGVYDQSQVADLTEYVVALTGADADAAAVERAEPLWPVCTECHGADGSGYAPYGGPNLTDDISLFGSDRETIADVIANGRTGRCPAWGRTLDPATVKALAVYIWRKSTGG